MPDYSGHFEIHLTARTVDQWTAGHFREWCITRGLKCVHIVLARGETTDQPMATWRRSSTVLSSVLTEAEQVARDASTSGIEIVRLKVEADPHNADVPVTDLDSGSHPPSTYFEHHIKLQRAPGAPRGQLLHVCERHAAHLSQNAFRDRGEMEERFVTQRAYGVGRLTALARLDQLVTDLRAIGEVVMESEAEYCVFDTNLTLDAGWLPGDAA